MRRWHYWEAYLVWTLWAFGWTYKDGHGWQSDTLTIALGPVRLDFGREGYHMEPF